VFVRRKKVNGNTYYQLVRNYREDGKHRQQVLCHLGRYKSIEAAIAGERELAEEQEREASLALEVAQLIKDDCLRDYAEELDGTFPASRQQAYFRWIAFWKEYRQEYWRPYYRWVHSQRWLPDARSWLPEEINEWEELQRPWKVREEVETTLLDLTYEYYDFTFKASRHKTWAAAHRTQLNKFLECKRKYF
jgi:hypothetical protein